MALITWKDAYCVGVGEIDAQHKQLVGMINDLHEAMIDGRGRAAVEGTLEKLIAYTRVHFAAEERLMQTHGYPGYEEHKAKHDTMTAKVTELQQKYEAGHMAITIEVSNFLQGWLDKHILGTDMLYAKHLQERGLH